MHDERHLSLLGTDRRRLVRAATQLLGPADAEDAVQDAYVRALEADGTLELNAAQAWLLTVMRNLAIDRLRRRRWMAQWLAEMELADPALAAPSAEVDAAMAEEAAHALRLIAAHLAPADGAAVLLHEVFEVGHAEIARAGGRSEASSRQQLRRALLRLRRAGGAATVRADVEPEPGEDALFRLYLQSLQGRDAQALWAMLNPATVDSAVVAASAKAGAGATPAAAGTCGIVQAGGRLGLMLTLDGVTLCVVPLGVTPARDAQEAALW